MSTEAGLILSSTSGNGRNLRSRDVAGMMEAPLMSEGLTAERRSHE